MFSYFRIEKLAELAKLVMKDSEKIVRDTEISRISELAKIASTQLSKISRISEIR